MLIIFFFELNFIFIKNVLTLMISLIKDNYSFNFLK